MNENENMNEQVEVENNNAPIEEQNGLTTGEKVGAIGVGAAAIIGCVTVGKVTYKYAKKGFVWLKSKFKKKEEVPTEEPTQLEEGKTEEVGA